MGAFVKNRHYRRTKMLDELYLKNKKKLPWQFLFFYTFTSKKRINRAEAV